LPSRHRRTSTLTLKDQELSIHFDESIDVSREDFARERSLKPMPISAYKFPNVGWDAPDACVFECFDDRKEFAQLLCCELREDLAKFIVHQRTFRPS